VEPARDSLRIGSHREQEAPCRLARELAALAGEDPAGSADRGDAP
jgi:hypothetical protein